MDSIRNANRLYSIITLQKLLPSILMEKQICDPLKKRISWWPIVTKYIVGSIWWIHFKMPQNIRKVIREKFLSLWRRPNSSFPAFVFVQTAPRHWVYWQVSNLWIQLEMLTDCVQLFRFKNITLKFNEKAIKTYIVMTNFAGPIRWIRFRIPQNICKPVREK